MLTYLGILLFIFAEMIFSEYAPEKSTNWSIFYFSSVFVSMIMISLNEIIRSYKKVMVYLFCVCCLFFIMLLGQQLLLINSDYDFYMKSVNDSFIDKLRHLFIIISFVVIIINYIIRLWEKRSVK
jgi:hypothetical protein